MMRDPPKKKISFVQFGNLDPDSDQRPLAQEFEIFTMEIKKGIEYNLINIHIDYI